nr:VanZ family protein [uncultured Roseateles sp.]
MTARLLLSRLITGPAAAPWWRRLTLLLTLVVLYLALSPSPPRQIDTGWDKSNHALAFASLMVSGFFGYASSRARLLGLWLALLALGAGIEIVQLYVPNRSGEWLDLLADTVGLLLGCLLALALARSLRQSR